MCLQWSAVVGPDHHSDKIITTTNSLTSIKIMKILSFASYFTENINLQEILDTLQPYVDIKYKKF